MLDLRRIAAGLALVGTLAACAAPPPPSDPELTGILHATKDAEILEPFVRRVASRNSAQQYPGKFPPAPTQLRILVSDRPGQLAAPDSNLGGAVRRLIGVLARNGIDAALATYDGPFNLMLEAMDPAHVVYGASEGDRFSSKSIHPNMRASFPGVDVFVMRRTPAGRCTRARVNPVPAEIPARPGDFRHALDREASRSPLLYVFAGDFTPADLSQHAIDAARAADTDADYWRDFAIACAFGGIMYGSEDFLDFIPARRTYRIQPRQSLEAVVSLSEPSRRFTYAEPPLMTPPGLGAKTSPSEIPTLDMTTIRALVYMLAARDREIDRAAHVVRMRTVLRALRVKYDAPRAPF